MKTKESKISFRPNLEKVSLNIHKLEEQFGEIDFDRSF